MKTIKFFIAAMAVIVAVSCVKDLEDNNSGETSAVASFSAERDQMKVAGQNTPSVANAATKTVLTTGNKVEWTAGDKVGLSYAGYYSADTQPTDEGTWNKSVRFTADSDGAKTVFSTTDTDFSSEEDLYAMVYPQGDFQFLFNSGVKIRCWLDDDQAATLNSFLPSSAVAVAKATTLSEPVKFQNVMAMLKFTITDELAGQVKQIAVTGVNEEVLGGNYFIDYSADAPVVSSAESMSVYKEMRLKSDSGMAAGNYYLAVLPGHVSNLTVNVTLSDGSVISRTSSSTEGYDLLSGYIYNMGEVSADNYQSPVTGLESLPYCLSLYGAGDNVGKWVNVERGGDTASEYNIYLTDKENNGVYLHCKEAGKTGFAASTTAIKANAKTGGQIRGSYFVTDQESFYKLAVPVAFEMPSSIIVSFGAYAKNAYQKWQLQYSKDDETWFNAKDFNFVKNNNTYPIVSLRIDFASDFSVSEGDMLYLRLIPRAANNYILGGQTDIWNSGHGVWLWGGIAIQPVENHDTDVPSDAVYFEAFDGCNGGVDYLLGGKPSGREKLATLANAHGDAVTSVNGLVAENAVARPGYIQLGHTAENWTYATAPIVCSTGKVTTPALETVGSLSLSFKAMAYLKVVSGDSNADGTDDANSIVVNILGGGTFEDGTATKTVSVSTDKWDTLTYSISGATADTQIEFTSPAAATTTRWFLDEIYVKTL